MKIKKIAKYDYTGSGINENSGYTKWYNKEMMKKKIRRVNIYPQCFMYAVLFAVAKHYSAQIKEFGINLIWLMPLLAAAAVFIGFYVKGFIRLIPLSKGRLDGNCILPLKATDWAVYNGSVTRTQAIASLVLPLIVFVVVFSAAAVFTSGMSRFSFLLMLVMSVFTCSPDIVMFVYVLKNIEKYAAIFGEYKKTK